MANISHSTLTDPYLHEPKGVATSTVGEVYVADGAGSGVWKPADSHIDGYLAFNAATPTYSHSTTTSNTVLNPTFVIGSAKNFSGVTTPNARLVYSATGATGVYGALVFSASIRQASGSSKDLQFSLYKSGVEIPGTRTISSISTGVWRTVTLNAITTLSPSDYLEVFVLADGAHTTQFAGAQLTVNCFPG